MKPEIFWLNSQAALRLAIMPRPRGGEWLRSEVDGYARAGLNVIVSLLERAEEHELGLLDEGPLCRDHGLDFISLPIADRSVPASIQQFGSVVRHAALNLRNGSGVGIHCRMGIGRASVVAACVMIELGMPASDVFGHLSRARGLTVPDTPEQAAWVMEWARSRALKRLS